MAFGRMELGSDPEAESDPGLELSLGLSLGRSFSKPREAVADAPVPPQRRRQLHAIRRQREKKQRKAAEAVRRASSMDDRAVLEAQARWRAREREAREQDPRLAAVRRLPNAPPANGFVFPCVMPCWAPAVSPAARADCRPPETNPFPPATPNADGGAASGSSDSRSGSQRGSISSTSSERKSSSTQNLVDKLPPAGARKVCNLTTACCKIMQENADKLLSNASRGSNATVTTASVPGRLEGAASVNKPVSPGTNDRQDEPSMPRMPCVSTTGDGPNGKTITGFLYRYSKSEVSIVCVCHGSSFSPTNFIRHAGGTDVSHPLRQIVMVSS